MPATPAPLWRLLACFHVARGLLVPEFGLLIDAGSTGSRLHIYEWPERVFHQIPPPLSHPITSERWTDRMKPGISAFAADPAGAARTLRPLIAWARDELADFKDRWAEFPIWLKATAGMRNLPDGDRARVMEAVRDYLSDNRTCPFLLREVLPIFARRASLPSREPRVIRARVRCARRSRPRA